MNEPTKYHIEITNIDEVKNKVNDLISLLEQANQIITELQDSSFEIKLSAN